MFRRGMHAEARLDAVHDFIHANPLGLLTTAVGGDEGDFPFLQAKWVLGSKSVVCRLD
ncbi:hypothetical protein HK405_011620 [Cladochytrium tenue]|nr:hypothetical protein HK405_011620 [Cladochytrium tenue]